MSQDEEETLVGRMFSNRPQLLYYICLAWFAVLAGVWPWHGLG